MMAAVPPGEELLKRGDVGSILEELLPAQNKSYELGLKLKLEQHVIDGIFNTYPQPQMRLLHILTEFLNSENPRPTWKAIIEAVKSPLVNIQPLARDLEAAHLPHSLTPPPSPSRSPSRSPHVSQGTPTSEARTATQQRSDSPPNTPMTRQYIQAKIKKFERRFNDLKKKARAALQERRVAVKQVVDAFTSMPADDMEEHKLFLNDHLNELYGSPDQPELFGKLSLLHWDYLSYQLLDYVIKEFGLEMDGEMETYKVDLQRFREKTPLGMFCESQRRRRRKPSEDFQEVVAEFDWPQEVTLEVVEQFRQEYAYHYCLRECAMMLAVVRRGSFIITWFIPQSISKKLRAKEDLPQRIMKKYSVISFKIAGIVVHPIEEKPATPPPSGAGEAVSKTPQQSNSKKTALSPDEDYPFVEKPPEDYICPVMMGLLFQPQLTLCCGNHLSEECAVRIQEAKKPCPLCKKQDWSTVLNKKLRRTVNALRVFCRYKQEGCSWEGELLDFEQHIQACAFRFLEGCVKGKTKLHNAARRGSAEAVRIFITTSINVNSRTEDEGDTALILAALGGHVEVVQLLLEAKAEPNIVDNDGLTPVYVASQEGHTEVVDALVKAGADVNQACTSGSCSVPLGIAAANGHTETVERLLEAEAFVNYRNKFGCTPLYYASKNGYREIVQLLVDKGAKPHLANEDGISPLYVASAEGHTETVGILLKAGADPNQACNKGTCSIPLGIAAEKGHTDVAQKLLDAGATINYQNKNGCPAIYYAAKRGHKAIVELLISKEADLSICQEKGVSALSIACLKGHIEIVEVLLDAGADVNEVSTKYDQSPVYYASWKGHTAIVKLLIDHRADITICNKNGLTPVYVASQEGHTEIVDVLVKAGADVDQQTTAGSLSVPLGIAAEKGHLETVRRLLEAGATVNYVNKYGCTPVFYASKKGHTAIVELLVEKGGDVSMSNKNGVGPVYVASQEGQVEVIYVLVKAGADVSQPCTKEPHSIPLGIAAEKGYFETVKRLLDGGAVIDYQNKNGCTSLFYASAKGHEAVIQLLIERGADPNICNVNGVTPVYVASQEGYTEVVDVLVKAGADVNRACTRGSLSVPLGIAAQKGFIEIVRILLGAGANVNHQNKHSCTPLYYASKKGECALVELLLKNGADVSICSEDGATPVYVATEKGHTEVVDVLVKAGADVNQACTTKMGSVPLGIAAENGHTETLRRLLEAGAIVNYQNEDGCTALLYAGWSGHSEVVKLLLEAGAQDIPDKDGDTALSLARSSNNDDVVQILMEHRKE